MKKILYLYFGASSPVTLLEKNTIDKINKKNTGFYIEFWDWTTEFGFSINPSLKWAYDNQPSLKSFYDKLFMKSTKYDYVFIAQTGGIIPEIMSQIKSKVIYNTADDPESSGSCSFPFVNAADLIVHAGVSFNKKQKIGEVLRIKGAKETYFMPIGFYEEMFPEISNFDKVFKQREIKIVFVGVPKREKLENIFRYFKHDIVVHCRKKAARISKLYYRIITGKKILPFTGELSNLYQNTQVGINVHYSFGPSNVRTYQLCAAGVAQVIDCPEGIGDIFVPEKDILNYSDQDSAIIQISKLLNDRDLRYYISKNGYQKTRQYYSREKLLTDLFAYI